MSYSYSSLAPTATGSLLHSHTHFTFLSLIPISISGVAREAAETSVWPLFHGSTQFVYSSGAGNQGTSAGGGGGGGRASRLETVPSYSCFVLRWHIRSSR